VRPGSIIADRYEIVARISAGGMGTIFRAEDRREGRTVALKILRGDDETDIERFVREAAILAELDHPNIVRYAGHGLGARGEHFLAMEWLEGEDLSTRLGRLRLSDDETLSLMRQAAAALSCAHARGAVHRDIKPSNLFLRERDVERLAIVDFGVAGLAGDARRLTQTGMLLGTPGYMAPEQVEGSPTHDPRSDVFSLGCVFFECLTGRPAFEGQNPMAVLAKLLIQESPRVSELRPEIPELSDLVGSMLAKNPAERPQSLADVALALERLPPSVGARSARRVPPPAESATTLHSADAKGDRQAALGRVEQRLVTVVLAGDTKVSVRVRPPPARSPGELAAVVEPYGGHLTPLAGGAMIVTTWAPGTVLDRAERAALCALALRERFPELPITVVTGRGLVAARVVEGDVIDRAAVALADTRPGVVSLDEATANLLPPRFRVEREADAIVLRGAAPAPDGLPLLLGKPTSCHGRAREMAMLEGIYAGAMNEDEPVASAVLVTGAAGAGKSRLRRELVERVRKRGEPVEVLAGRADSLVSGSPFGVVADVIRGAAGIRDGEPLEVRRKKLTTRLARAVPEAMLRRIAPFLGELISTPFPDAGDAVLVAARDNALLMGDAMRAAWEEWLTAECQQHPVLLVLEDMQWGDGATARLVDSTLRNLRELPLMVLVLARPEAQADLLGAWTKRDVPVIRLGPLPTRAAERLVREALGADVADVVVHGIVERAAGNPFYLEELIRAVAAGRGDVLPDSVLGTVEARLDAEGTEAKRALRAASVFGDRFWVGGVAALLGGDRHLDEARRMLVSLTARELVAPSTAAENEYVFCHTIVREAAHAMLTEADRALGHQLAGDWLERTDHTDAMAMAEHFRLGGEPARAVRWYRRAAEQALEANDLPAALDRCALGVGSGAAGAELGTLRLVQAEAHVWRGELDAAEARGSEAMTLLDEGSTPWFRALHQVVNAASKLGGLDRVERLFALASTVVPQRGARRAQIIALAECPGWFVFAGHYALAVRLIATIEEIVAADPAGRDAEVSALLHQMRAIRASGEGDLGACREGFAAALESFEAAGDQRNATSTRSNLGSTVAELGDFEGAEVALRAALAGAERMGLFDSANAALSNLGHVLAYRGNLGEARLCEQRAIEAFHRHGDARWEGVARTYLAKIALLSGDFAMAARGAREAADRLLGAPPLRPAAQAVEARALLGLGRVEEALGVAREAFAALEAQGALEEGEALVRLVHAEALAARGETEAFRVAIEAAREQLLARAGKIRDLGWRERFLHGVPDNARTLELAERAG
jgi:tetratricopeptide (TPR) repeat protein